MNIIIIFTIIVLLVVLIFMVKKTNHKTQENYNPDNQYYLKYYNKSDNQLYYLGLINIGAKNNKNIYKIYNYAVLQKIINEYSTLDLSNNKIKNISNQICKLINLDNLSGPKTHTWELEKINNGYLIKIIISKKKYYLSNIQNKNKFDIYTDKYLSENPSEGILFELETLDKNILINKQNKNLEINKLIKKKLDRKNKNKKKIEDELSLYSLKSVKSNNTSETIISIPGAGDNFNFIYSHTI